MITNNVFSPDPEILKILSQKNTAPKALKENEKLRKQIDQMNEKLESLEKELLNQQ